MPMLKAHQKGEHDPKPSVKDIAKRWGPPAGGGGGEGGGGGAWPAKTQPCLPNGFTAALSWALREKLCSCRRGAWVLDDQHRSTWTMRERMQMAGTWCDQAVMLQDTHRHLEQ